MKVKKLAFLLVVAVLTLGTAGTMTALADPPATDNEVSQTPNEESRASDGESQDSNRNLLRFQGWRQRCLGKKPIIRSSDKHRKRFNERKIKY